jgi:hypothetical protein
MDLDSLVKQCILLIHFFQFEIQFPTWDISYIIKACIGSQQPFMALAQLLHYTYWFWLVPVNFQNDEGCL